MHSYREPGTYTVTLTVSNYGCDTTISKTAYITAVNPFPRFNMQNIDCANRTEIGFEEKLAGHRYPLEMELGRREGKHLHYQKQALSGTNMTKQVCTW